MQGSDGQGWRPWASFSLAAHDFIHPHLESLAHSTLCSTDTPQFYRPLCPQNFEDSIQPSPMYQYRQFPLRVYSGLRNHLYRNSPHTPEQWVPQQTACLLSHLIYCPPHFQLRVHRETDSYQPLEPLVPSVSPFSLQVRIQGNGKPSPPLGNRASPWGDPRTIYLKMVLSSLQSHRRGFSSSMMFVSYQVVAKI